MPRLNFPCTIFILYILLGFFSNTGVCVPNNRLDAPFLYYCGTAAEKEERTKERYMLDTISLAKKKGKKPQYNYVCFPSADSIKTIHNKNKVVRCLFIILSITFLKSTFFIA